MANIEHITPADGNVFADLGFEDAENLKLRATLMRAIIQWIEDSGLDDKGAAETLGLNALGLSQVRHGQIDKFTIDQLILMLSKVGVHATVTVKTPPSTPALGSSTPVR